jgi:hypothetical protein
MAIDPRFCTESPPTTPAPATCVCGGEDGAHVGWCYEVTVDQLKRDLEAARQARAKVEADNLALLRKLDTYEVALREISDAVDRFGWCRGCNAKQIARRVLATKGDG